MLLKHRSLDHKTSMTWGHIFFLIGILSSRISKGGFLADPLRNLLASESLFNAIQDFAAGISIPLLGISIYLNLKGLRLFRSPKR
jgi:hypothetical protein